MLNSCNSDLVVSLNQQVYEWIRSLPSGAKFSFVDVMEKFGCNDHQASATLSTLRKRHGVLAIVERTGPVGRRLVYQLVDEKELKFSRRNLHRTGIRRGSGYHVKFPNYDEIPMVGSGADLRTRKREVVLKALPPPVWDRLVDIAVELEAKAREPVDLSTVSTEDLIRELRRRNGLQAA